MRAKIIASAQVARRPGFRTAWCVERARAESREVRKKGLPWVMLQGDAKGRDHVQENHQPTAESAKGAAAASGGGLLHKSGGAQRVPLKTANAGNVNSPYEGVRAESSAMDTDTRGESHSGAREPEEQVKKHSLPNTHSNTIVRCVDT
jgi:hypothetical protein